MGISESIGAIVAFLKTNPLVALVIGGIILFAFYRRPGLSFFILILVVALVGVYYLIMDASSSAVSEKQRLVSKSVPHEQEEVLKIDPSRMLR